MSGLLEEEQVERRARPRWRGKRQYRVASLHRLSTTRTTDALTLLTRGKDRSFLLAQRETSPAVLSVLETCPCCQKKKFKDIGVNESPAAEAERKVCLELDRSVCAFRAVLPRQFFRTPVPCRQQSYQAVAARTRRERLQRWRRREPSTSAHTSKGMRASVRKPVLQ
ncbi:hypothetical protein GWK47_004579 [Chionoecetes opilio]|uniref:Uncharacterized protein n=1 Tax=Chionoecetes opilio TaxID=41210 RepID=A0A8J4YMI6_CHIOP|nr:hypothetical protein GWK47_004579 [Chionoecetes opilio]